MFTSSVKINDSLGCPGSMWREGHAIHYLMNEIHVMKVDMELHFTLTKIISLLTKLKS